jgi:hypothetical protein
MGGRAEVPSSDGILNIFLTAVSVLSTFIAVFFVLHILLQSYF